MIIELQMLFALFKVFIILITVFNNVCMSVIDMSRNLKTFSFQCKGWHLPANSETVLFSSKDNTAGILTHQWGADQHINVFIYIDYEIQPSISFNILLAHGLGFCPSQNNDNYDRHHHIGPFESNYISQPAKQGGFSNFYKIPFSKHIKITVKPEYEAWIWYLGHGVYNMPMIFYESQLKFPENNSTRLYLYKTENITLKPVENIILANISNSSGVLFQITLVATSKSYAYLEACLRAKIDGEFIHLSSGTEDIFGGSLYYDWGETTYAGNQFGATYVNPDNSGSSTYRFFTQDPILFYDSFQLIWKNGDHDFCNDNQEGNIVFGDILGNTTITSYVWIYQFFMDDSSVDQNQTPQFQGSYDEPHFPCSISSPWSSLPSSAPSISSPFSLPTFAMKHNQSLLKILSFNQTFLVYCFVGLLYFVCV